MNDPKNTPYEKWSRAAFKLAYEEADALGKRLRQERDEARGDLAATEKRNAELKQQFDDLKQRLHAAETANQYMRGYIARVQEDDTVREELVAIGDPTGEQQMVPKRKPTAFLRPDDFTHPQSDGRFEAMGYVDRIRERDRKPKHWITY